MNGICEMVFILDCSGSMRSLKADTIGGFNSMIAKERADDVNGMITAALFNGNLEIPFDRVDLKDVPEMTEDIYDPRGCTALYDAVGHMIMRVKNHRKDLAPTEIPQKTVFVITTDGCENASRDFSGPRLRRLIEQQKEEDWEFLYLGANIDASVEADRIGIRADQAVRYHADPRGIRRNFESLGDTLSCYAQSAPSERISPHWAEDIEADYFSRESDR